MMPARVFLIDSMALVRLGLSNIVNQFDGFQIIGEASDSESALAGVEEFQPDLCIMDIILAGRKHLQLIEDIKLLAPRCRILVSTNRDELVYADQSIAIGADGFISKNEPANVFESAIEKVLLGQTFISDNVHRAMFERMRLTTSGNHQSLQIRSLSTRELEIFELIGQGHGATEIAADLAISTKTVESHRQNIRNKLGFRNMSQLICSAAIWAVDAC